jgi:hypothetical protein
MLTHVTMHRRQQQARREAHRVIFTREPRHTLTARGPGSMRQETHISRRLSGAADAPRSGARSTSVYIFMAVAWGIRPRRRDAPLRTSPG